MNVSSLSCLLQRILNLEYRLIFGLGKGYYELSHGWVFLMRRLFTGKQIADATVQEVFLNLKSSGCGGTYP